MTRGKKLVLGGLTLAAVVAGVAAASAHRGEWGHGGGRMGMMGHGGGGMMGAVCKGDGAQMADHMLVNLEYKVKPTDAQKPAFEELKAAARAAAAKAKAGCPAPAAQSADGKEPPRKTPVERLAMMEAGLAAQLDAVRTVRPAADKFFASLTEDQRKQLIERGPGGPGGWNKSEDGGDHRGKHGWGHGDRGGAERGGPDRGGEPGAKPGPDKN